MERRYNMTGTWFMIEFIVLGKRLSIGPWPSEKEARRVYKRLIRRNELVYNVVIKPCDSEGLQYHENKIL